VGRTGQDYGTARRGRLRSGGMGWRRSLAHHTSSAAPSGSRLNVPSPDTKRRGTPAALDAPVTAGPCQGRCNTAGFPGARIDLISYEQAFDTRSPCSPP
jgi:hypothetical protein